MIPDVNVENAELGVWIGAQDNDNAFNFLWIDGTPSKI